MAKLYRYESVTAVVKLFKCTACNKAIAKVPDGEVYGFYYRFCPNCGAKITYEGFDYMITFTKSNRLCHNKKLKN